MKNIGTSSVYDFFFFLQTWMDAFEGAKNAKKEVESAISTPQMFPQKKDAAK
jgi:hypothetical protein